MGRSLSKESIEKMTEGYEAEDFCVCPLDGEVFDNPNGLPCAARTCSDGETRLVGFTEDK